MKSLSAMLIVLKSPLVFWRKIYNKIDTYNSYKVLGGGGSGFDKYSCYTHNLEEDKLGKNMK